MQRIGYFSVLSLRYKKGALKMTPVLSEALRLKALPMYFSLKLSKENLLYNEISRNGKITECNSE
jgi:hypothetical protein